MYSTYRTGPRTDPCRTPAETGRTRENAPSTPVSYTHLDVYKRQQLDIIETTPFSPQICTLCLLSQYPSIPSYYQFNGNDFCELTARKYFAYLNSMSLSKLMLIGVHSFNIINAVRHGSFIQRNARILALFHNKSRHSIYNVYNRQL